MLAILAGRSAKLSNAWLCNGTYIKVAKDLAPNHCASRRFGGLAAAKIARATCSGVPLVFSTRVIGRPRGRLGVLVFMDPPVTSRTSHHRRAPGT